MLQNTFHLYENTNCILRRWVELELKSNGTSKHQATDKLSSSFLILDQLSTNILQSMFVHLLP